MYLYFSSVEQFDFSEMLDKTIKNYSPNDMKAEKKDLFRNCATCLKNNTLTISLSQFCQ